MGVCNRAATELQQSCNRAAELAVSASAACLPALQQSCNRAATSCHVCNRAAPDPIVHLYTLTYEVAYAVKQEALRPHCAAADSTYEVASAAAVKQERMRQHTLPLTL